MLCYYRVVTHNKEIIRKVKRVKAMERRNNKKAIINNMYMNNKEDKTMNNRTNKRIDAKMINKYQVMSAIYAMYMAIGSIFGSVDCIFDTERAFFRNIYKKTSCFRDTGLEAICMSYIDRILKERLVMDTGFEKVSCYISYNNYDDYGCITFINNRIELDIEISKEGEGYSFAYYEQIIGREPYAFSTSIGRCVELGA